MTISDTEAALRKQLKKLCILLEISDPLEVIWVPDEGNNLRGEVKGRSVYIYERDADSALKTLKHEVLDYLVCKAIEPYREVTNRLIEILNERAYKDKEQIVERLCEILDT